MSNPRKIYRQGDLLLIEEVEADLSFAVREGEEFKVESENGSSHVIKCPVYKLFDKLYLVVDKPSMLIHRQHPTLLVEPGIYRIEFVRDYALETGKAID